MPSMASFENEVLLLNYPNYKITTSFSLRPDLLATKVAFMDTGAGPNCVRYEYLSPGSMSHILASPLSKVNDANSKPTATVDIRSLFFQSCTTVVKTEFLICCQLSVPFILGTTFIDRNLNVHQNIDLLNGYLKHIILH